MHVRGWGRQSFRRLASPSRAKRGCLTDDPFAPSLANGWHRQFEQKVDAQLTVANPSDGARQRELVATVESKPYRDLRFATKFKSRQRPRRPSRCVHSLQLPKAARMRWTRRWLEPRDSSGRKWRPKMAAENGGRKWRPKMAAENAAEETMSTTPRSGAVTAITIGPTRRQVRSRSPLASDDASDHSFPLPASHQRGGGEHHESATRWCRSGSLEQRQLRHDLGPEEQQEPPTFASEPADGRAL